MHTLTRTLSVAAATTAVLATLAACADSGDSGSDGGSPQLTITSPKDGADVGSDVEITWDSNVDLGEPDTGRDHVHVFVDGQSNDYTVVGGNEFTVKGLSPGEHTLDVTLQHADHSDAGAEDEVDVMVGEGGPTDSPTSEDATQPSYDY